MYKLILVDDEREICEGLKEVVPFETLGFTVIGEAANGVEALQLCEAETPDLLITDIRMPLMDGLTLCRRVRALYPTTQLIILSGYDEFEYARQAIEVQTMGYLLKPISSSEFIDMLQEVKITLDEAFAKRLNIQRLRQHFRESLPLLREMLLSNLLAGGVDGRTAQATACEYDISLYGQAYSAALMRIGECLGEDAINDDQLRLFAVRNILCEVIQERGCDFSSQVFMHNGMLAILFVCLQYHPATLAAITELLEEARKTIQHYLACPLFIGVSGLKQEISHIPAAAREAQTAMDQCILEEKPQVLCAADLQPRDSQSFILDEFMMRQMINSLKAGDGTLAQEALSALMDACRSCTPHPKAYQTFLLEVVMAFLRITAELSLEQEDLARELQETMRGFFDICPTIEQATGKLHRLMAQLLDAILAQRQSSSLRLASEAEQYLQLHYAQEDLSLEKLCVHLHISPSYFSSVFKKETHKTFHQYITELRMDRALTLLSTTEMKTAQIAQQVGLPDPSYFSYCFKKHFGYPPSQARKRKEETQPLL